MSHAKDPVRSKQQNRQDLGSIDNIVYNDATGANKVIMVQPAILRATTANENVGAGKLIKISAASYGLDLIDKAYDPAVTYQRGDVVTESGFVYVSNSDNITGAFDVTLWRKAAPKVIAGIFAVAGDVVSTGRWHNSISVAGWLIDDESEIRYTRIRD